MTWLVFPKKSSSSCTSRSSVILYTVFWCIPLPRMGIGSLLTGGDTFGTSFSFSFFRICCLMNSTLRSASSDSVTSALRSEHPWQVEWFGCSKSVFMAWLMGSWAPCELREVHVTVAVRCASSSSTCSTAILLRGLWPVRQSQSVWKQNKSGDRFFQHLMSNWEF